MEELLIDPESLVGGGDLMEELQGVLIGDQAVFGAVQDQDRIGEVFGMLFQKFDPFMDLVDEPDADLFFHQRIFDISFHDGRVTADPVTQRIVHIVVGRRLDRELAAHEGIVVPGQCPGEDDPVGQARMDRANSTTVPPPML